MNTQITIIIRSVCADVRPVLREVFRELHCLPPLTATPGRAQEVESDEQCTSSKGHWVSQLVLSILDIHLDQLEFIHRLRSTNEDYMKVHYIQSGNFFFNFYSSKFLISA